MTDYHVTPHETLWPADKEGASRASSAQHTQAEAIQAPRGFLESPGGDELNVHGTDGQIRTKDTVAPGGDSRNVAGQPRASLPATPPMPPRRPFRVRAGWLSSRIPPSSEIGGRKRSRKRFG